MAITVLALKLQAYEGKITIHAVDENGIAVTNARAGAQFQNALKPGEGWGNGRPTEVKGITDTNGMCVLAAEGTDSSVSIGVMKDGYYYSSAHVHFTNADFILHRWQPWNPTVEVVLKKKGIQVPMYARRIQEIKIPVENQTVGFDLMKGAWVEPYGRGEANDLVFKFELKSVSEIKTKRFPEKFYDASWTVSLSNDGDGIQSFLAPPHGQSELRLPRQAPAEGYEAVLVKRTYRLQGKPTYSDFREDQNYFFRVRTKKDEKGQVISALYGKIPGDIRVGQDGFLRFTYYLNPELNSRNMEFDPGKNLFSNLKKDEQVTAP